MKRTAFELFRKAPINNDFGSRRMFPFAAPFICKLVMLYRYYISLPVTL